MMFRKQLPVYEDIKEHFESNNLIIQSENSSQHSRNSDYTNSTAGFIAAGGKMSSMKFKGKRGGQWSSVGGQSGGVKTITK